MGRFTRSASSTKEGESLIPDPSSWIPDRGSGILYPGSLIRILCPAFFMPALSGMAHTVEELPLYSEVRKFWDAVHAILQTSRLRSDYKLWKQISDANDSVEANLK
jgi:hypothetical protein